MIKNIMIIMPILKVMFIKVMAILVLKFQQILKNLISYLCQHQHIK